MNPSCSITSLLPSVLVKTKVQALINPDLGVWKPDLIHQLFLPHEDTTILGIPLSRRCLPDKIAWAYSPLGLFTTSSAYKLLVSCDVIGQAGSSNMETQKQFWKGVWRLHIPNKIKHFIW